MTTSAFHLVISKMDYLSYLRSQTVTTGIRTDLQLTVTFFDTARHYQELLDPSAYFLTAWLPDARVMRQHGIVADYLRRPEGWKNKLLEPLLIRSQKELFSGDYRNTEWTLQLTNRLMDIIASLKILRRLLPPEMIS